MPELPGSCRRPLLPPEPAHRAPPLPQPWGACPGTPQRQGRGEAEPSSERGSGGDCPAGQQVQGGAAVAAALGGFGERRERRLPPHLLRQRLPSVEKECQSAMALQLMTRRCHGKRSCSVYASTYEFGDPCYPGVHKHLNVIYTCVPKKLLHETQPKPTNYQGIQQPHFPQQPRVYDPNVIGDGVFFPDVSPSILERVLPEKKKGRSATFYPLDNTPLLLPVDETQRPVDNSSMEPVGVSTEMALLSNILAAYSFITENPERAALYFVSGVCIGLILTLLALVLKVSCQTDCKQSPGKKPPREPESDSDSSDSEDDSDTTSDLSARRHRRFERTLNMNVFTSAEELERAQRLEERERIIREIWMNGQPDIPGTRSLNRYY
ncbi:protein eva-1 homolog A isoform 2-T2 [Macrochelys suwanniensis]